MRSLRAFVLGVAALGIPALVGALAVGTLAQAAETELALALGPLTYVSVARTADGAVTTLGLGILVIGLVGGVANVVASVVVCRRRR